MGPIQNADIQNHTAGTRVDTAPKPTQDIQPQNPRKRRRPIQRGKTNGGNGYGKTGTTKEDNRRRNKPYPTKDKEPPPPPGDISEGKSTQIIQTPTAGGEKTMRGELAGALTQDHL